MRHRLVALLVAVLVGLSGCAATKSLFTNPTGQITIDRQKFINTFAVVKVLYKRMHAQAVASCEQHAKAKTEDMMLAWNCQQLPAFHAEVQALAVQIEAKIEVPESEIDWAVVTGMLKALVSLVPG